MVGLIAPIGHELFSDIDYAPQYLYSYFAIELAIPMFVLGVYFSPSARIPLGGIVGLAIGFWMGSAIINAYHLSITDALSKLLFPWACEILGVCLGKLLYRWIT